MERMNDQIDASQAFKPILGYNTVAQISRRTIMVINYDDKTKNPRDEAALKEANKVLEEVVSVSSAPINAEWKRTEDSAGRTVYRLEISDWTGLSPQEDFYSDELKPSPNLRFRLYGLLDKLLKARVDKKLQELALEEE
jgi:hypothetical protein